MSADILPSEKPIFSGTSKVSTDYTFKPAAMTVTIHDSDFKRVLYIVNSTYSVVLYNPYDKDKLGTITPNGIILNFPLTAANYMGVLDDLLIMYESESPPAVIQGGDRKVNTANVTSEDYLGQILKQLKIMNYHLEVITDETIDKTEIE